MTSEKTKPAVFNDVSLRDALGGFVDERFSVPKTSAELWRSARRRLPFRLGDELFERLFQSIVQFQATVEVLLRFAGAALQQAHQPTLGVAVRMARHHCNGLCEIRLRLLQVSLKLPAGAAIEPGVGIARVKRERLIVIGERAIKVAFGLSCCATVAPGFVKIGLRLIARV